MTFNERQSRSPQSRGRQVLMRLQHEAQAGNRAITSFATICDMISIPRDLRATLLEELVRDGYVTRSGDTVQLTAAGNALALDPTTPPTEETRNPPPHDGESRVRTPSTGRR